MDFSLFSCGIRFDPTILSYGGQNLYSFLYKYSAIFRRHYFMLLLKFLSLFSSISRILDVCNFFHEAVDYRHSILNIVQLFERLRTRSELQSGKLTRIYEFFFFLSVHSAYYLASIFSYNRWKRLKLRETEREREMEREKEQRSNSIRHGTSKMYCFGLSHCNLRMIQCMRKYVKCD